MSVTTNMGLVLPTPTVTPGPTYATENNAAFTAIDSHNHTSGQGVPVPSAGININGDLSFNSYNLTSAKSIRATSQSSALSGPSDLSCWYVVNGDFYYNNSIGQQIQITAGGALNATSIGGIGGDYSTSTASVFYTSVSTTFTFWQASNVSATLDVGTIKIREQVASAKYVSLSSPVSLSANYALTLPSGLPASTKLMSLDSAGNIGASLYVDGSTIKVTGNNFYVDPTSLNLDRAHQFEANGIYTVDTYVDGPMFFKTNATITNIWIYNLTAGSSGTTEFDLKLASPGGAWSSIMSTTGKITSAAASNIWTDMGSVVSSQTGVTKPILTSALVSAGQALRFDILQKMTGAANCGLIVEFTPR